MELDARAACRGNTFAALGALANSTMPPAQVAFDLSRVHLNFAGLVLAVGTLAFAAIAIRLAETLATRLSRSMNSSPSRSLAFLVMRVLVSVVLVYPSWVAGQLATFQICK